MSTQGEGKCQINNEDGPREAAEEAIEIRQGVLAVQPTEVRAVCSQCRTFKSRSCSFVISSPSVRSRLFLAARRLMRAKRQTTF